MFKYTFVLPVLIALVMGCSSQTSVVPTSTPLPPASAPITIVVTATPEPPAPIPPTQTPITIVVTATPEPHTPTRPSRPKPTSTPVADVGLSRGNPVPIGSGWQLDNGSSVFVQGTIADATQMVRRHDPWITLASGHQFFIVTITVVNKGEQPVDMYEVMSLSLVGNSNVSYPQGLECWTYPDEIDITKTLFPGGSLTGNLCFSVPSSEVDSLVMYYEPLVFWGTSEIVYWALR